MNILSPVCFLLLLVSVVVFAAQSVVALKPKRDSKSNNKDNNNNDHSNNNNNNNNNNNKSSGNNHNNYTFPPLVNLVSTLIGTGGFGFGSGEVNPGAQVPFGNMRLGPDTSLGLEPFSLRIEEYGGYYYGDSFVEGFTHTHTVGAGASDFQNFLVMPIRLDYSSSSSSSAFPSTKLIENAGYKSRFSHNDREVAKPGYYSVHLETPNVFAEVTVAGTHSGIHRYTCAPPPSAGSVSNSSCAIVFDMCHAAPAGFFGPYEKSCRSAQIFNWSLDPVTKQKFSLSATMTMAGSLTGRAPRNGGVVIYFYAELSFSNESRVSASELRFSDRVFLWENYSFAPSTSPHGGQLGPTTSASLGMIVAVNGTSTSNSFLSPVVLIVRTGISFISAEYAKKNMYHEQQSAASSSSSSISRKDRNEANQFLISFDQAASRSINEWEKLLSRFTISAPTNSYNEPAGVFMSLIYRTHLAPTTYSEFDGSYLGMDYLVHNVNETSSLAFFSDCSIWDIYRAQTSLLTFSAPESLHDVVVSMLEMSKQYQHPPVSQRCKLPKWPIANIESGCMVGTHSSSVILDAVNKNISWVANRDPKLLSDAFDVVADCILEEVRSSMPAPGFYCVGDAGRTLELGIDAGSVLYTARKQRNISVSNIVAPYATQSYKNLFDTTHKIPCPRRSADPSDESNFDCPTLFGRVVDWIPYPFESRYVEASAVDSRWIAPQDLDGLFHLLGGPEASATLLESFFYNTFHVWPLQNTTLQNPWFDPTNEPTMLVPYLFCMCGPQYAPRTTYYVQKILREYYFYGPAGTGGNIDYGGLDAFAVFGYLGIYPVVPTTNYTIFTPMFDRVTIDSFTSNAGVLPHGIKLTVLCTNRTASVETNYVASVSINGKNIGSRAWFAHEELYENMTMSDRSALIEMTLSPVPVTIGNPTVPPFNPSNSHALDEQKYIEQEMLLKSLMKKKTSGSSSQTKKGLRRHKVFN